jgi:uncharacterized repeat protein (TIGR03837 family)
MQWDLFCRVIDNYGDIGLCWRLARDLAARGESVRLWVDDPAALAWMAPGGAPGVEVGHWTTDTPVAEPGEAVIEAFGCDPPEPFVLRMAHRARPPLWINLEYLSAEGFVERSHGLPSPQMSGPGRGLRKWFFYPGFTPGSGGLIREDRLIAEREAFDAAAWLHVQGIAPRRGERLASLFCYDSAPVSSLLAGLSGQPTLLLLAPGAAQRLAHASIDAHGRPASLRCIDLPWLSQAGYDRLLWSCELNFVRGEDSFVRAQWAGAPFVWQIYPQQGQAHVAKLGAFLGLFLGDAPRAAAGPIRALWLAWNGLHRWPDEIWPQANWRTHALRWRDTLAMQPDLVSRLLRFVQERR